jgi:flotillin
MEISCKERELDASVKKAADAQKYHAKAEAEAESYRIHEEAKTKSQAQRLEGAVEAELIRAKAEAEAILKKAESWKDYNEAMIYKIVIDALPELARAVSEPLSKIEKIVMVGSSDGSNGIYKITEQVAQVMAQLPTVVESLSGVDLTKLLEKFALEKNEKEDLKNKL